MASAFSGHRSFVLACALSLAALTGCSSTNTATSSDAGGGTPISNPAGCTKQAEVQSSQNCERFEELFVCPSGSVATPSCKLSVIKDSFCCRRASSGSVDAAFGGTCGNAALRLAAQDGEGVRCTVGQPRGGVVALSGHIEATGKAEAFTLQGTAAESGPKGELTSVTATDASGKAVQFEGCELQSDSVTFPKDSVPLNSGAMEGMSFSCASADGCTLKGTFAFGWCPQQ
jgi:hypothetical protein